MNIYMIEDDPRRHRLLARLINELNAQASPLPAGPGYRNGFGEEAERAFTNVEMMCRALQDPDGLLLLDIALEYGSARERETIRTDLRLALQCISDKILPLFDTWPEYKDMRQTADQHIGALLLAAAIVLNCRCVVISQYGAPVDLANRYHIPRAEMPKQEEDDDGDETYWRETLSRLVIAIDEACSPYKGVSRAWRGFATECDRSLFGIGSGWHSAGEWFEQQYSLDWPRKIAALRREFDRLATTAQICKANQLADAVLVTLGRGATRGLLSLPFLGALVGQDIRPASPFAGVHVKPGLSPGTIAKALYDLVRHKSGGVAEVTGHIASDDHSATLALVAKFATRPEAERARDTLSQSPRERLLADPTREGGGTAVTARHWLSAASKTSSVTIAGDREVVTIFEFPLDSAE